MIIPTIKLYGLDNYYNEHCLNYKLLKNIPKEIISNIISEILHLYKWKYEKEECKDSFFSNNKRIIFRITEINSELNNNKQDKKKCVITIIIDRDVDGNEDFPSITLCPKESISKNIQVIIRECDKRFTVL